MITRVGGWWWYPRAAALAIAVLTIAAAIPARGETPAEAVAAAATRPGPCGELLTALAPVLAQDIPPAVPRYPEDDVDDWLRQREREFRRYLALATPACRAEVRDGRAPGLPAVVADLIRRWPSAGWVRLGRLLGCAIQDPAQLSHVAGWMAADHQADVRTACYISVATWPGAAAARWSAFAGAVGQWETFFQVDPALLASLAEPGGIAPSMRDELVPTLTKANEHRARGFDRLRQSVCVLDPGAAAPRVKICAATSPRGEEAWRRETRGGSNWPAVGASALFVGAVAGVYVSRDSDVGLGLTTGAGAVGGATLGGGLGVAAAFVMLSDKHLGPLIALGAVAGGIAGALIAHGVTASSPNARTPVTAGALALPLIISLKFGSDL